MNERPILFSGPMVRAILDGRKTQTRRIVKSSTGVDLLTNGEEVCGVLWDRCPYGVPGDRLWVRETWSLALPAPGAMYRADYEPGDDQPPWRPSIHMPRWASRITLEIIGVRVERLQDISEDDAKAEGAEAGFMDGPCFEPSDDPRCGHRIGFEYLWDSINAKRAPWDSNPWVWVLMFRRVSI